MNRLIRPLLVAGLMLSLNVPVFSTRLVSYHFRGETRLGAWHEDQVVDLNRAYLLLLERQGKTRAEARAAALVPPDVVEFLQGEEDSLQAGMEALNLVKQLLAQPEGRRELEENGVLLPAAQVRLGPAVPNPPHLLAVGRNYRLHAEEVGAEVPEYPIIFTKEGKLIGPGEEIVIPKGVERPDYEAELAFVIGKRARNVKPQDALEYVAGYAVFNDVTARDIQDRVSQWTLGKSPDTFAAMGAHLVLRDEVPDPQTLGIRARIGDEVLQDANTSDMIFTVADLLAYVSQFMTLQPGTVVATGTPSGVGEARQPPRFLQPGDTIVIEIDKLGAVANPVVREP